MSQKIKHSKIKNTGLLFEILTRQVTADILDGRESKSVNLLKKYFNENTALGKEKELYDILMTNSYKDEIVTKTKAYKKYKGHRGNIYDRNENLLAYSIQKCRIWINNSNTSINDKNKIIDLFSISRIAP